MLKTVFVHFGVYQYSLSQGAMARTGASCDVQVGYVGSSPMPLPPRAGWA
jgi:hypothetical protein